MNNFEYSNLEIKEILTSLPSEREILQNFLSQHGLKVDNYLDYTIGITRDDKLIATGSLSDKTLRSIAVDPYYQGEGIINKIVSILINKQIERGNNHYFIYTKPASADSFTYFGFKKLVETPKAVLLESSGNGLELYLNELRKSKVEGEKIAGLVMNCNPFTLGHRYLIEKASKENDFVHVFIVWEDRSAFPSEVRYRLVKEGIADLKNVYIHKGEDYTVSSATFPSYFLKDIRDSVEVHAQIDLTLFTKYIAPALGINRRYAGIEPYCDVTAIYNEKMKELFPEANIELIEVPRKQADSEFISASKVRKLIYADRIQETVSLVPPVTFNFLNSPEAAQIIERIKNKQSRH